MKKSHHKSFAPAESLPTSGGAGMTLRFAPDADVDPLRDRAMNVGINVMRYGYKFAASNTLVWTEFETIGELQDFLRAKELRHKNKPGRAQGEQRRTPAI